MAGEHLRSCGDPDGLAFGPIALAAVYYDPANPAISDDARLCVEAALADRLGYA